MYFAQGTKLATIALLGSLVMLGYTLMSVSGGVAPEYDLTIDNIPVNFNDDKTIYLDTQTNDRGFVIYGDYMVIRSPYITYYELNNSYEHEDVNYVVGSYCYTPAIPAQNATLTTENITAIDRFSFHAYNGTVTVSSTEYSSHRMTLNVNSTDNATLLIRCNALTYGQEYRVILDGTPQNTWLRVNWQQYFEYNYTGSWSNHTISFINTGGVTFVPSQFLNIIQTFLILGVVLVVVKSMVLPLRHKKARPEQVQQTLIHAAIYIVVATAMISLTFRLFVGV